MGCFSSRGNDGLEAADVLPAPKDVGLAKAVLHCLAVANPRLPVTANGFNSARPISEVNSARHAVKNGAAIHLCDLDLVHFSQPLQLYSAKTVDDVYEIERLEFIGQGGLGTVRKAVHKHTQALRAVKIISPHALKFVGVKALQHEVGIMRTLDHPHIIKLYEVFQDACVYLIMELCTGGELFDRIVQEADKGFTESRAAEVMRQILLATKYLHTQGIVHRDLKPENFMLQDPSPEALIKVIDFGLAAKIKEGGELTARVGTTRYVAPEVLTGCYAHKADIWSCGVVCFILLSGSPPFHGQDAEMIGQIMHAEYSFPEDSEVSEEAKDFIRSMLKFRDERPEASELLQHPWIQHRTARGARSLSERFLSKFQVFNCSRRKAE